MKQSVTSSSSSVCRVEAWGDSLSFQTSPLKCRFSFHVRSPSMTAASQIKEVLAGCGLIKLLFCLCIIVWILTRHTAIEPPKILHYAANSNNWYIYIYEYIYDVFCHRIPLELEEKKEHNGFKLPHVTVMRFMFNAEFPWAPRGSRTTLVAPEAAAGETTKS